jgi:hypothetical protein
MRSQIKVMKRLIKRMNDEYEQHRFKSTGVLDSEETGHNYQCNASTFL